MNINSAANNIFGSYHYHQTDNITKYTPLVCETIKGKESTSILRDDDTITVSSSDGCLGFLAEDTTWSEDNNILPDYYVEPVGHIEIVFNDELKNNSSNTPTVTMECGKELTNLEYSIDCSDDSLKSYPVPVSLEEDRRVPVSPEKSQCKPSNKSNETVEHVDIKFSQESKNISTSIDTTKRGEELFLKRAMRFSRDSQEKLLEWDRRMGLKKCHSKTMRETMRSRKRLRPLLKKYEVRSVLPSYCYKVPANSS